MPSTPKLIVIVLISLIVGGAAGYFIFSEPDRGEGYIPDIIYANVDADNFFDNYYDSTQKEFKMTKDSQGTLAATYFGLSAIKKGLRPGFGQDVFMADIAGIFDKISSYYSSSDGYYSEAGIDPVNATRMALAIDTYYEQDLGNPIKLTWLHGNSLGNENLEQAKFDPEYQYNVLMVYRNSPQKDLSDDFNAMDKTYADYYCNYEPASDVSDSEYLREKYYQSVIVDYLLEAGHVSPNICAKTKDLDAFKARTAKISFSSLNDLKELEWLHSLNRAYGVRTDYKYMDNIIRQFDEFYLEKGFREKLSDSTPDLTGMFYGSILYISLFGSFI